MAGLPVLGPPADPDLAPLRGVLDRVGEDVRQDLIDADSIGVDEQRFLAMEHFQRDALPFRRGPYDFDRLRGDLPQVGDVAFQRDLAGGDAACDVSLAFFGPETGPAAGLGGRLVIFAQPN